MILDVSQQTPANDRGVYLDMSPDSEGSRIISWKQTSDDKVAVMHDLVEDISTKFKCS